MKTLPILFALSALAASASEPQKFIGKYFGRLGQEKFGYLEGVANADARALRVM